MDRKYLSPRLTWVESINSTLVTASPSTATFHHAPEPGQKQVY
jgi:hypothetical protein